MNIIITGASRGIGAETALLLAKTGNHNIILISRDYKRLEELCFRLKSVNSNGHYFMHSADLSDEAEILQVCTRIAEEYQHIDILINNAGFLVNKPFKMITADEANRMFVINLLAPAIMIRELLPLIMKSSNGHIVNIGSMGGFQGSAKFPGLSYYSASKGALAILTECLAEEYKETGIKINCLALGSADTEMLREAFPGYKPPLTADEMAEYIANFALKGHKFFNGKILPVSLHSP
jgi:short-subunit dehydrogenase